MDHYHLTLPTIIGVTLAVATDTAMRMVRERQDLATHMIRASVIWISVLSISMAAQYIITR
jgi:hypothetical protein